MKGKDEVTSLSLRLNEAMIYLSKYDKNVSLVICQHDDFKNRCPIECCSIAALPAVFTVFSNDCNINSHTFSSSQS